MDEIILFEPFIDVSNESELIQKYTKLLREEIIFDRFTDHDTEKNVFFEHAPDMLGTLTDYWYDMSDEDRKLADGICELWCHANLEWYEKYDTSTLDFYQEYRLQNTMMFAGKNPPQRVSNHDYITIRKRLQAEHEAQSN